MTNITDVEFDLLNRLRKQKNIELLSEVIIENNSNKLDLMIREILAKIDNTGGPCGCMGPRDGDIVCPCIRDKYNRLIG